MTHGQTVLSVKRAIEIAKDYVREVLSDEAISNVGLEETEYQDGLDHWLITIGFSRPWNKPRTQAQQLLENMGAVMPMKRSYKILTIDDQGQVLSMKNRANVDATE